MDAFRRATRRTRRGGANRSAWPCASKAGGQRLLIFRGVGGSAMAASAGRHRGRGRHDQRVAVFAGHADVRDQQIRRIAENRSRVSLAEERSSPARPRSRIVRRIRARQIVVRDEDVRAGHLASGLTAPAASVFRGARAPAGGRRLSSRDLRRHTPSPCRRMLTRSRTMASPRPRPPCARVVPLSAWRESLEDVRRNPRRS